ncbi:MAG: hypothetical protein KDA28_02375, partial [Phycisphaerales bacterium]|nr:hypothetical protein [Phycisphaerales bacterium]
MSKSKWLVRLAWIYGAAALLSVGLFVVGVAQEEWTLVGLAMLGLVIIGAVAPLSFVTALQSSTPTSASPSTDLESLRQAIERLGELSALSDDARRVLNRQRERDLLCKAIEEDIASEDWGAALVLCKELAERFGYRVEAEEFRGRIETARFETVEHKVADAVSHLDGLIIQRRWTDAFADAARIGRLYPESPRVEGL